MSWCKTLQQRFDRLLRPQIDVGELIGNVRLGYRSDSQLVNFQIRDHWLLLSYREAAQPPAPVAVTR